MENKRLSEFKDKYQIALTAYGPKRDKFNRWQSQYDGEMQPIQGKKTETLFNLTQELVETMIDSSVPAAKAEADKPTERNKGLAQIAEKMLRAETKRLKFDEENDEDERTTKIHGGDLRLIEWDNTQRTHDTVGALSSLIIHPLQHIPQEGVFNPKLKDYDFLTFEKTKSRIKAQYGVDVTDESVDTLTTESTQANETVTQKIIVYRNKKNTIGMFSWVGDTVLIDDDEYNARGKQVCAQCGETKPTGEKKCKCGSTKWEKRNLQYEELTEDVIRSDGSVIPRLSPARYDDGSFVMEDYQEQSVDAFGRLIYDYVLDDQMNVIGEQPRMITKQRVVMEPTKIPYYVPKSFPLCIRKNVSKYKDVLGGSDCGLIENIQDKANKISTKWMKKGLNAGSYLTKPKGLPFNPSNSDIGDKENQVIELEDPSQKEMIKAVELKFDPTQDIATLDWLYNKARSLLGINDTSQGKQDPTATSGVAKQIQVQRAMGRQESKIKMKNAFYADCYRVMFEYMLAYADEPREYKSENDEGDDEIITFNRYDFLEQDEYGNWYYNDEFTFSVDSQGNTQENRQYVGEVMTADFSAGLYGPTTDPEAILNLWKDREAIGHPNAKRQVARWSKKVEAIKQMQEAQAQAMAEESRKQADANAGIMTKLDQIRQGLGGAI